MSPTIKRYAPFLLSLFGGLALWEIVGRSTSPAFMVPLSATIIRLVQLAASGELGPELASSLTLFATGFALAVIVGLPLGLLLARIRLLREALDLYIMILYATPMVALIPFILSLMGFGFAPNAGGLSLRRLPDPLQHGRGRPQHQAGAHRGRPIVSLERMVAVARGHAALHAALRHDRNPPGDRPRPGRHGGGGILP
jgi:ABC-type amino acid transport system permease subunit